MLWLRILTAIFPLLIINTALASESAYTPPQRFMPLPPPKINSSSQHQLNSQPTKFFPLTQSRYPMPIINNTKGNIVRKDAVITKKEDGFPPTSTKIISGNTANMSQEQAKQIISIFATTQ